LRYLDPFHDRGMRQRISADERATLRMVNQKVAAKQSLNDVADFLFEHTRDIIPCDRIGLAFVDESGERVISQYARATYQPLLLTKGYTADLRGTSLEPGQEDKIDRMIGKGEYLLGLVQDYLDLARIDGGDLTLARRQDVDVLADVIAPSLDLVRSDMDQCNMRLELDLPTETATAECDPGLLRIVMTNLLSNAIKYGAEGGLIRVRVIREPSRLEVAVWNEGPGFAAEDRGRLFQRFSRLRTPGEAKRGTGVGLYSAWRIVQLHNGRIRARSEAGSWAEFAFELPQPLDLPGSCEKPPT
jgi:signal transduction histidine kinase